MLIVLALYISTFLFPHVIQAGKAGPKSKLSCNPLSSMFQEAQALRKMGFTGKGKVRTMTEKHFPQLKREVLEAERLVDPGARVT